MTAKKGDRVHIHYTGSLDNGDVFDSSQGRAPLEFVLGSNQVIPGFEKAVTGMETGEKKKINIPCEEAYGPHDASMVAKIPLSQFPSNITPQVGQQLEMQTQTGEKIQVMVTSVDEENAMLDANHPLAGQSLNFELELVSIG